MKLLLLADVHSNWPALEAIAERERFDACLVAGDLVDYGCDPLPCIEWCRQNARVIIRGNHDHAVAQRVAARGGSGYRALAAATRPLHWQIIPPKRLNYLGRLPITRYDRWDDAAVTSKQPGNSLFLVHGTPRDPLDEYLRNDSAAWEDRLRDVDPGYVLCGHTHEAMHLTLERHQVINPGSVGQPRDGEPGAAYAVLENGRVELRRIAYDIDRTLAAIREADVADWVVELSAELLRTGGAISKSEMDAISGESP